MHSGYRFPEIERLGSMTYEQATAFKVEVCAVIQKIRDDMRHERAAHLAAGRVPDSDSRFRRAGTAARHYGRMLQRIEARLSELKGERATARRTLAEQFGTPEPSELAYAANVLESSGTRPAMMQRVAAWLRAQAEELR